MVGPDCLLTPKLALTMALSLSDARLNLEWCESGGPPVAPPNHRGFGTRLILRALEQFGGKVEATFASTGLVCKLDVPLPTPAPSTSGPK
jgi:two-component sensor histidine kinase